MQRRGAYYERGRESFTYTKKIVHEKGTVPGGAKKRYNFGTNTNVISSIQNKTDSKRPRKTFVLN